MDARVDEVVSSLNAAGFQSLDICVFLSSAHPLADEVRTLKSVSLDLPDETGCERLVAWLATFGDVVIPGVGLFVGSRDFLRALACGLGQPDAIGHGPLTNLGIPAPSAERYETRLLEDDSLIFVACDGSVQSEWARDILRLLRADESGRCAGVRGRDLRVQPSRIGMDDLDEVFGLFLIAVLDRGVFRNGRRVRHRYS